MDIELHDMFVGTGRQLHDIYVRGNRETELHDMCVETGRLSCMETGRQSCMIRVWKQGDRVACSPSEEDLFKTFCNVM